VILEDEGHEPEVNPKPWFYPKPMVQWLSPMELLRTAREVVISGIFGSYADKREVQAALPASDIEDYSMRADKSPVEEIWVDYVSDLGDGFHSTYTVAYLLAKKTLSFDTDAGPAETKRGQVLIMGGDQVYPTATVDSYRDRLVGPYRAALTYTKEGDSPHLYAIPGNHDWYDGLTSFMRVFCQQSWVGGWLTKQSRSYFACKMPGNWWIWGIDIQFDTYIDWPQLTYFRELAKKLKPGDAIILCTAKPSWVEASHKPDAWANLAFFERKLKLPERVGIKLMLTGDTHHYAHYAEVNGDGHKITAGGGGAYLSATHHLPRKLTIPPKGMRDPYKAPTQTFELKVRYPSKEQSKKLRSKVFSLPLKNRGFVLLMAILQLLVLWSLWGDLPLPSPFQPGGLRLLWETIWILPFVLCLLAVAGWFAFVSKARTLGLRLWLGVIHGLLHAALALFVAHSVAEVGLRLDFPGRWIVAIPIVLLIGGLASSLLTAGFLIVADRFKCNTNELFSAQSIEDYKNFVRLHFDRNGELTIYPIGIDKAVHWEEVPPRKPEDYHHPKFEGEEPVAHLIEHPLVMVNDPGVEAKPATAAEMS
jgi:hypothetical protein